MPALNPIVDGLTATQPLTQTQTPPPTPSRAKAGSTRLHHGLQSEEYVQCQPQTSVVSNSDLPVDFDTSWIHEATPPLDDDIIIVSEQESGDLDLDRTQALSTPGSVTVPESTSLRLDMMMEIKRTTKRIDENLVQTWRYMNRLQQQQEAQGAALQIVGGIKAAIDILVDCERERRDEAAAIADGLRRIEMRMMRIEEKAMRREEYSGRSEGELVRIREEIAELKEEQRRTAEAHRIQDRQKMQTAALLIKQVFQALEEVIR